MRCSPKDGSCGRTVRFSIDDELLTTAEDSFRSDSSGVAKDGIEPEAVGAPTNSVVVTEDALSLEPCGRYTLVRGGCGEGAGLVRFIGDVLAALTAEKLSRGLCGERSG